MSPSVRRTLLLLATSIPMVTTATLVTTTRHAFAQGTSAQGQAADSLFAEGRDLLEKGRFTEACAKLARSEQLAPAVGTLLNLGYCLEQLGKLRGAMEAYAEAEVLANAAGDTKRAAFAKDRFAAVEPRTFKLIVRVAPPEAPGLVIKRNGAVVPKTDLDRPIAVDPEDYVVTASAPGFTTWKGAMIVRGEGAAVTVIVPPLAPLSKTSLSEPSSSFFTPKRIAALGLGAASALTLGAGLATALAANARYDDSSAHCDHAGCDATGQSLQQGAVRQGNIATLLVGMSLLCAGAGVYLWLSGAPEGRAPAQGAKASASPRVGFGVSPFGAQLGGRF